MDCCPWLGERASAGETGRNGATRGKNGVGYGSGGEIEVPAGE